MDRKNPLTIYKGLPSGVYVLFFARVIDNMGSFILPLITLILTQKIGLSKSQAGTFATIFMITQAPFLLLGGKLTDILGSKTVIVAFTAAGALFYLPCGFIRPGLAMAVLIAMASDIFSITSPAYNSIVVNITPGDRLKSAYSLLYLAFNLGYAVGPTIGGLLFNRHLHLLFILDSATALLSTALIYLFVPVADHQKAIRRRAETRGLKNSSVFRFLFTTATLPLFALIFLCYNFVYSQWTFLLPLQISDLFGGDGAQKYSLLVAVNAVTVILFTPVLTTITHHHRPLRLMTIGGLLYAAAFFLFAIGKFFAVFLAAMLILTVGEILVNINSNLFIARNTPKNLLGRASSLLSLTSGAGFAIGPAIMGNLLTYIRYFQAWLGVAVLTLLSGGFMFRLSRTTEKAGQDATKEEP